MNIKIPDIVSSIQVKDHPLKYTINDSTISEKCQGMCCSFHKEKDKPKVGVRSNLQERLQIRAGIIK